MIIIYFLFLCFLLLFLVSLFINKKAHNYEGRTEGEIISIKVLHIKWNFHLVKDHQAQFI